MTIEHVAIWTTRLEEMKAFYVTYFDGVAGAKYRSPTREFESYFLSFASGARLELMQEGQVTQRAAAPTLGYAHIAFCVDSPEAVDKLAQRLADNGVVLASAPRRTGDGYYEAAVKDPDGNLVEIVARPE